MRKLFFQQSSSRLFRCFQFFSSYIYCHFATNAKNLPSSRSFRRFLFFPLFPPFSLFFFFNIPFVCVYVYVYVCVWVYNSHRMFYKKSNSNFSTLASTTKICRTRRIEKIGVNKFFEDHRVADKKNTTFRIIQRLCRKSISLTQEKNARNISLSIYFISVWLYFCIYSNEIFRAKIMFDIAVIFYCCYKISWNIVIIHYIRRV